MEESIVDHNLVRRLTFHEWKQRSVLRGWGDFERIVEPNEFERREIYYATFDEDRERVISLMETDYWESVGGKCFEMWLNFTGRFRYKSYGDMRMIEREILKCEFILNPDTFSESRDLVLLNTMSEQEKQEARQIAVAYSQLLDNPDGHWEAMRKNHWDRNFYTRADAIKRFRDGLVEFREFCKNRGVANAESLYEFNQHNADFQRRLGSYNPTVESIPKPRTDLSLMQIALILRYSGKPLTNPASHPESKAARYAKEMGGKTSKTSGIQLFGYYQKARFGPDYHKFLITGVIQNPMKVKAIKKHLTDLKAVIDYLNISESNDIKNVVQNDFERLSSEYETLVQ